MRIEEAIQQTKPFSNAHQRAIVNLMYTSNWLRHLSKNLFKPFGITNQQYNALRILKGANKPLSTSIIRERLLDKMADTSRLVDRLAQKGYVIKRQCPDDKRLVDIELSQAGVELLKALNPQVEENNNQILNLTEEEADQLSFLLDKARG